ncbi:MAG: CCA tRNA nucleotidyltransferase [Magnetovibrio sp.]|nr:CCA tRNA nucleotidyltransferase [Magnetovibrio sp.]
MSTPETLAVMAAFRAAGAEARFIGGCVRDAVLGRAARDIDIATPQEPERVLDILQTANIRAIPTGIKHGTITAVIGAHHFEITTLRIDVESYGRHAKVEFTDDWTQDAARRDFTINAMSCDEHGNIYDPYNGLKDLGRGWVRFVGVAHQRIEEDVLRLLRFFRFYAEYGKPPISRNALMACRKLAPRLPELSGERVRGELFRILTAPNPADTVSLMRSEQILNHILEEAGEVGPLRMLAWLLERAVKIDGLEIDPVRRLAALLKPGLDAAAVFAIAQRLKFSNRERKHLQAMCAPGPLVEPQMSAKALHIACAKVSPAIVMDRALLAWAAELAHQAHLPRERTQAWRSLIETARDMDIVPFPLKGRDVLAKDVPHGPKVGQLLSQVEAWWMDQDFHPSREECLNQLSEILKIQNSW